MLTLLEYHALAIMKAERIENYPSCRRAKPAYYETNAQPRRLDEILDGLGESSSSVRDTGLGILGNVTSLTHATAQDEILKNSFATFAFKSYEIAAYKSLSQMAHLTGQSAAITTLQEEMNMASKV